MLTPQPMSMAAQVALRLTGTLQVTRLHAALTGLADRYPVLRSGFSPVTGALMPLMPLERRELALPVLDLSGERHPRREPDEVVATVLAEESLTAFDAAVEASFRCWLVRIDRDDHVLSLVLHRRAAERYAADVLLQDLPALYARRPVPGQAAVGSAWLDHPVTAPPPPGMNYEFVIPPGTVRAVRELAGRLQTGFAEVVTGVLAALLGRCAQREEVVLGLPAHGGGLRVGLSGDPRTGDVVARVVDGLAVLPLNGVAGPYQVVFESVVDDEHRYGAGRWDAGLRAGVAYADITPPEVDLACLLSGSGDQVKGRFRYRTDALPGAAAEGLAACLVTVLEAAAQDGGRPFSRIPVFGTPGFHRLARRLPPIRT